MVGAIYWLTMARVVRGQVISLKNEQFVEAARAVGSSQTRVLGMHILPNLLSVVIVYLTLTIPRVMLFEAFLSFLGLGVEPPDISWGLLANEGLKVITPGANRLVADRVSQPGARRDTVRAELLGRWVARRARSEDRAAVRGRLRLSRWLAELEHPRP